MAILRRENFPGIVYSAKREGNFIRLRQWNKRVRLYHACIDDLYDEICVWPVRGRHFRRLPDGSLQQYCTGVGRNERWRTIPTDEHDEWLLSVPDSGLVEIRETKGDLYRPERYLVWHYSERDSYSPGRILIDPDWYIRLRKHSLEHSEDPANRQRAPQVAKLLSLIENGGAAIFHDRNGDYHPEIEPIDIGSWPEADFAALLRTGAQPGRTAHAKTHALSPSPA